MLDTSLSSMCLTLTLEWAMHCAFCLFWWKHSFDWIVNADVGNVIFSHYSVSLFPLSFCIMLKGGVSDCGEKLLIFELKGPTRTPLPLMLIQKLWPANSWTCITKATTLITALGLHCSLWLTIIMVKLCYSWTKTWKKESSRQKSEKDALFECNRFPYCQMVTIVLCDHFLFPIYSIFLWRTDS